MIWLYRVYLIGWILGFGVSAILHLLLPEATASASAWELAQGWQREIGLWNIAATFTAIWLLWRRDYETVNRLLAPATLFFTLLSGNHLMTIAQSAQDDELLLHAAGAAANAAAVIVGCMLIFQRPRNR